MNVKIEPEVIPLPPAPRIVEIDRRGNGTFVGVRIDGEHDFTIPTKDVPRVIDALCREGFDGMDAGTRAYLREQARLGRQASASAAAKLAELQAAGAACPDHRRRIAVLEQDNERLERERDDARHRLENQPVLNITSEAEQRALRLAEVRGRNLERLRAKIERLEAEKAEMFDELDDARRALVKLAKGKRP